MFIVGGPTIVGDEHGAIRKLTQTLDDISKREIKVRDRVDISLEEYERMKNEIRRLNGENIQMRAVLGKFHIPLDVKIIPDSIEINYAHDIRWFKRRYRIEFEAEDI